MYSKRGYCALVETKPENFIANKSKCPKLVDQLLEY